MPSNNNIQKHRLIFVFVQILALLAIFRSSKIPNMFVDETNIIDSPHQQQVFSATTVTRIPIMGNKRHISSTVSNSRRMTTATTAPETLVSLSQTNHTTAETITMTTNTTSFATAVRRRLPTLNELTSISGEYYKCPDGYEVFKDVVLPRNVTHPANRKIPKIVHITAKSRCVTKSIKKHILRWKFPDHSLYLHDDNAVYKLLNYAANDRYGNELVQNLSLAATCMTTGATLSDIWRYVLLYYYGGIYTDIDNAPGAYYSIDFIQPHTDSFFFVEAIGTMSQYYFASSKFHPIVLHTLNSAITALWKSNNVMKNLPAKTTGPSAVKHAMILFREAINITSSGYEPEGTYIGGLGNELLESIMPWYNESFSDYVVGDDIMDDYEEYPSPLELLNRTVTVFGEKGKQAKRYLNRAGMSKRSKENNWKAMNMTHYHKSWKSFPKRNQISCKQHASRVRKMANATRIDDIAAFVAKYEVRGRYYFDKNTNERIEPWVAAADKNNDDDKKGNNTEIFDRPKEFSEQLDILRQKVEQKMEKIHRGKETDCDWDTEWECYYDRYADSVKTDEGIERTKESAKRHYINHGKAEGRICHC